jgi:hypothetical protein
MNLVVIQKKGSHSIAGCKSKKAHKRNVTANIKLLIFIPRVGTCNRPVLKSGAQTPLREYYV